MKWIKEHKFLLLIILVGAVLRFYRMDYQSVWMDELHTLKEADPAKSFSEVFDALMASEALPPLYFLMMNIMFKIFGYTIFVARLFSALIGIAGIYTTFLLGKELYNKKLGLYAAVLLAFNWFHIYYSQEARPYGFLFLTTTLSFIYLVRFIKLPNYKSAILWGVFTALMLYGHFFGFFALAAQCLILLFFLIKPHKTTKGKFLIYCLVSGLVAAVLYIPSYKLLIKTTEIDSIWIQMPSPDVYTIMFKDFFSQSELVVCLVMALIIFFFIRLFQSGDNQKSTIDPNHDKDVFGAMILLTWIFISVLLPLIRTYTSLPMLVNRYFINVLPAVLILVSVGLLYIKNKFVRGLMLSLIVVFTLTDLIIVKKYYATITKTQFRETADFIVAHNSNNDPIYTSLAWYYSYFLKSETVDMNPTEISLEELAGRMMQDSTNVKSFWYADAHQKPYGLSPDKEKFLERHFALEENIEMYDAWARRYVKKPRPLGVIDLSKFGELKEVNGTYFSSNIEKFEFINNIVSVVGWAFFDHHKSTHTDYDLVLVRGKTAYKLNTMRVHRPDNTSYFKKNYDVGNSGFNSRLDVSNLPAGRYTLGIYLTNKVTGEEGLKITDKTIEKQ